MLNIKNVYKNYGKAPVLKGVNLFVETNEIKALIGMNGAGKSTLLENICGVKKFDSGEVVVDDLNVLNKNDKVRLKHAIGYMPQQFGMFSDLTVEENLKFLCAVYNIKDKNVVENVIAECFLEEKRKILAQKLSGGYKQLLSLACAMINNPKLLILDEPTSAMDPLFRNKFWNIIHNCKGRGATVLVVTHHMEELNYCDSFACLYNGKIVHDAKIQEHKKNNILDIEEVLKIYHQKGDNE